MRHELQATMPELAKKVKFFIGDVRNPQSVRDAMPGVDYIFHLNYDKFVVKGEVQTEADESYTSHNTIRLDVDGTIRKLMTTDYVRNALEAAK